MDKNDVIDYVMTTPGNTNRAVLSSILNQLVENGSSSDFDMIAVTFNDTTWNTPMLYLPHLEEGFGVYGRVELEAGETQISAISAEGIVWCEIPDSTLAAYDISVSGSAERWGDQIKIMGPCTITVSPK